MRMQKIILFLICALAYPVNCISANDSETQWQCRNGAFAGRQDDLHLAKVTGPQQINFCVDFSNSGPPCTFSITSQPGLLPGDRVLINKLKDGWACVYKDLDTSGWIRESTLTLLSVDKKPAIKAWVGKWHDHDTGNMITLKATRDGKRLLAAGEAIYKNPYQYHTGSFTSTAAPAGNKLQMNDEDCSVQMTLVADRLVVSDNNECGGMNVRFDGVYTKRRH